MKRLDRRFPLALLVVGLGACDAILGIPERSLGAHFECLKGECKCEDGWGNCDGNLRNGCEVNLENDLACGACNHRCENSTCDHGACVCTRDYKDCDGLPENGCETDLGSDLTCGDCDHRCDNGRCMAAACVCLADHADCDGRANNGCEAPIQRDAANCGACGHGCAGGSCDDGRCGPVRVLDAGPTSQIWQMIVADDTLYYLSPEAILKVPKAGGTPTKLCDTLLFVRPFRIWNGAAYWSSDSEVFVCPLDGSAPKILSHVIGPGYSIGDTLVGGGGWVYWLEIKAVLPFVAVLRRARADGTGTSFAVLAFDADPTPSIFADDTGVYWVDAADSLIGLDHSLSGPTTLSVAMPSFTKLLKKEGLNFYLSSPDSYYKWSSLGGASVKLAPPSFFCGFFEGCEGFDQDYLYFSGESSVRRASLAGGEVMPLSPVTIGPAGVSIAVDEAFVYFTDYAGISRVRK